MICFACYAAGPATASGTQTTWTRLLCHFGASHTLALRRAFALSHAKSNYSRRSRKFSRKSNHSRTYAKTGGWGLTFELSTFDFEPVFSPKSNCSRTSAAFSPKSNHSRTYAKTGGWGGYHNGNVSKLCRRADIFGHGVLQGTADANSAYRAPTRGEKNQPEGWPLQGRGGKRQGRKKRHWGEWRSQPIIFWREVVAGSFGRCAARTRGRPR